MKQTGSSTKISRNGLFIYHLIYRCNPHRKVENTEMTPRVKSSGHITSDRRGVPRKLNSIVKAAQIRSILLSSEQSNLQRHRLTMWQCTRPERFTVPEVHHGETFSKAGSIFRVFEADNTDAIARFK